MPVNRRLVALLISSSLLLSASPVIAAEKNNSSKEVTYYSIGFLDSLVELFPELKGYHLTTITMGTDTFQNDVIYIGIGKSDKKKDQAQLTIDRNTGEIVEYLGYHEAGDISDSTAIKRANAFMKKLVKKEHEKYVITDTAQGMVYYSKLVNDIPFVSAGYSILLDSKGIVTSFHKARIGEGFKEKDFAKPSKAMTITKAKKYLPEEWKKYDLRLVYMVTQNKELKLVYQTVSGFRYAVVDAITGDLLEY